MGCLQCPGAASSLGSYHPMIFGHMPKALAAAASDPSPLTDLLEQFPVQEAIVQEGTARNTEFTLRNRPRLGIFPGGASWI